MNRTVKILITVVVVVILLITGILVFMEKKTDDLNDYEKNQEQNTEVYKEEKQTEEEKKQTEGKAPENEEALESTQNEKPNVDFMLEASKGEDNVTIPTFMYFVSDDDADLKTANEVIEKLKKEYEGIVNFDIRNVTKEPENLKNFPVEGSTPALIMLNSNNDISNILFKNSIYTELKQAIEEASK